MMMILVLIGALALLLTDAVPNLVLTSVPSSSEPYCPGPVLFTCNTTDISPVLHWELNDNNIGEYTFDPLDRFPLNLTVISPLVDSMQIISATLHGTLVDIIFTLRVSNVSVLEGSSLHCEDLFQRESNAINNFAAIRQAPPPPYDCSSSILRNLTLKWSDYFNTNYSVEKYHVNITPDISNCSSDQVPPDSSYICSGLEQGTEYSISISAINCQSQEGRISRFSVTPQAPVPDPPEIVNVETSKGEIKQYTVKWQEQRIPADPCSFSGITNFTVFLNDSAMIVKKMIVSSDSCINGTCTTTLNTSHLVCYISILAKNEIFQSNVTVKEIDYPQLTLTNYVLLGLGIICTIVIILLLVLLLYFSVQKRKQVAVLLVGGVIPIIVLTVLYVAFGLLVGLQDNRCDADWQNTRNNMIIGVFTLSLISLLLFVIIITIVKFLCSHSETEYAPQMTDSDKFRPISKTSNKVAKDEDSQPSEEFLMIPMPQNDPAEDNNRKVYCSTNFKMNIFKSLKSFQVAEWLPQYRQWPSTDLNSGRPLKVYFLNQCPRIWQLRDINEIMKILSERWKKCFVLTAEKQSSQIRVIFEEEECSNWTILGTYAKAISPPEPTMSLNFANMSLQEIKATIIHQFGHALGLGHALMKPHDWKVVSKCVDVNAMMRSYGVSCLADFETQWTGKGLGEDAVNYDEKSVMGYSIKPSWLKNPEKKLSFMRHTQLHDKLSTSDKKILNIIALGFNLVDEFKWSRETNSSRLANARDVSCNTLLENNKVLLKKASNFNAELIAAWFPKDRRWTSEYFPLKVYFMNACPYPCDWTGDEILAIANSGWTGCFISTKEIEDSQVSVLFEDKPGSNWTILGFLSAKFKSRPTMSLNFKNMNIREIRATILHQFGHALGIGHSLMGKGVWEIYKDHIDLDKMIANNASRDKEDLELQWTGRCYVEMTWGEKGEMRGSVNYDQKSIMHYSSLHIPWAKVTSAPHNQRFVKFIEEHNSSFIKNDEFTEDDKKTLQFILNGN